MNDLGVDKDIKTTMIMGNNEKFITYNEKVYIPTIKNLNGKYDTENIVDGKFAIKMPIGYEDYSIELGSSKTVYFTPNEN